MDMSFTITAQIAVFAAVCMGPMLALGIRPFATPARASTGYVRRHLGER